MIVVPQGLIIGRPGSTARSPVERSAATAPRRSRRQVRSDRVARRHCRAVGDACRCRYAWPSLIAGGVRGAGWRAGAFGAGQAVRMDRAQSLDEAWVVAELRDQQPVDLQRDATEHQAGGPAVDRLAWIEPSHLADQLRNAGRCRPVGAGSGARVVGGPADGAIAAAGSRAVARFSQIGARRRLRRRVHCRRTIRPVPGSRRRRGPPTPPRPARNRPRRCPPQSQP